MALRPTSIRVSVAVPLRLHVLALEDRVVPTVAVSAAIDQGLGYRYGNDSVSLLTRTDEIVVGFDAAKIATIDQLTSPNGPLAGLTVARMLTPTLAVLIDPAMTFSDPNLFASRLAAASAYDGVTSASPVFETAGTHSWLVATDRVIVAMAPGITPDSVFAGDSRFVGWEHLAGTPDQYLVTVAGGAGLPTLAASNQLAGDTRFQWVSPNFYRDFQRHYTPNDPLLGSEWHLDNTGQKAGAVVGADASILKAWDIVPGGSASVTVAVLDDGIELTHPDLAPNIATNLGEIAGNGLDNDGNGWVGDVNGWDFTTNGINGDNNPAADSPTDIHGTSVAGVIAAKGNNGIGVAGVAFNTTILPVRIFGSTGAATTDANIASAIYYAAGRTKDGLSQWSGAQILNNSWGGLSPSAVIRDAFAWAGTSARNGKGVISIVSSGNDYDSALSFPANLAGSIPGILAVGASTDQDHRAFYSNYGPELGVVAPSNGGAFGIVTTDRQSTEGYNTTSGSTGNYTSGGQFGGTSSAAPVVSGIAALLLARDSSLTAADIRGLIRNTTDYIGPDPFEYDATTGFSLEYGYGRVNAFTAVSGVDTREIQVLDVRTNIPDDVGNVSFGTAGITAGDVKIFRVRNQGTLPLSLGAITLTGPFTLVSGFGATTLNVGETTTFTVRFLPNVVGPSTGTVSFPTNDADEAIFNFNLTGIGANPSIAGTVFEDANADGVHDPSEPGLAGRQVFLDANGNGTYDANASSPTFASGPLNVAIPDGDLAGLSRTITVAGQSGTINDLNVTLNITHGNDADLVVQLIAPNGRIVLLSNGRGGAANNFTNTVFDDEAATSIAAGSAPFTGSFRPERPLSAFDGFDPNGVWTIRIVDEASGNAGVLVDWSLTMALGELAATTDASGAYSFNGLTPGTYTVTTVVPSGWTKTVPIASSYSVVLGTNGSVTGQDFGLVQMGSIYGRVIDDRDANGILDAAEPGLADRRVYIDANGNGSYDATTGTPTVDSGSINLAIPDNDANGVTSSINVVGQSGFISGIDITVNITHPYVGDLILELIAPDNTTFTLVSRRGSSGANFNGTIFDGAASTSIVNGTAPFTGRFRPEQLLGLLDGSSPNGAWKLRVRDEAGGNAGTLLNWSIAFSLGELSAITDASGNYKLRPGAGTFTLRAVVPTGWTATAPAGFSHTVTQGAGVATSRDFGQTGDSTPPTADIVDVAPDPRSDGVASIAVAFSESVTGVDIGDFTLTRDGTNVPLTGVTLFGLGTNYTLSGLAALTTPSGHYALKLTAFGSGIADAALNALAADATETWTTDSTPPTATLGSVSPNPRNTAVSSVAVAFDETVVGLGIDDFRLTRDGVVVPLTGATLIGSGSSYTMNGLAGLSNLDGNYALTLVAAGSNVTDAAGNAMIADATATWKLDTVAPTADVVDVAPDPRNTAVGSIAITFDESVVGVDRFDFALTLDGVGVSLGSAILSGSGASYTLSNLSFLTGSSGTYILSILSSGSGIADLAGNLLAVGASDSWVVDTLSPTADVIDVSPDPRTTAVSTIAIDFSEAVVGFDLADLTLTKNAAPISLAGATLTTADGIHWTLGNLTGLTSADATYVLALVASGSGIADAAGNLLVANASDSWLMDALPPAVTIGPVLPDPRNAGIGSVSVTFTETVTGFDLSDLALTRNSVAVSLTGVTIAGSGANYTVNGLAGLTSAQGTYVLKLVASTSGIADVAGKGLTTDAADSWIVDTTIPTATLAAVTPNLRNSAITSLAVTFSEPVTGVTANDFTLTRNGVPISLASATITGGGSSFTLGNLTGLTGTAGLYVLTLNAAGSGIVDTAANALAANATASWTVDTTAPSVSLSTVAPDPRNVPVGSLTITFNEPVAGFDLADLILARNGRSVDLSSATLSGSGAIYTLGTLDSLTAADGAYAFSVLAGSGIRDVAGNALAVGASRSWSMDAMPPIPTILTITPETRNFVLPSATIAFSEPVIGFDLSDLTFSRNGTAIDLSGVWLSTTDSVTWTLSDLTHLAESDGVYTLAINANGSGIRDAAGNAMLANSVRSWTVDRNFPTATVVAVVPSARNTPVASVDVNFSEDVLGVDLAAFTLTRDGVAISLAGTTVSGSGTTYTISGLASLTGSSATYVLALNSAGSGITDVAGNALATATATSWQTDLTRPSAMFGKIPALQSVPQVNLSLTFNEPVVGLDPSDLRLTRDGATVALAGVTVTGSGTDWVIGGLAGATGRSGAYTIAFADGNDVRDLFGNGLGNHPSVAWRNDALSPIVSSAIVLSANATSVLIRIAFSKPVTGFSRAGLVLGGTAGATTATIASDNPADGSTYLVTITGMSHSGTVELGIGARAARDAAGNPTLEYPGPVVAAVTIERTIGSPKSEGTLAIGADVGGQPIVRVLDAQTGAVRFEQTVFDAAFTGGVRVATADFNRDGIDDVVVGTGPGIAALVRVLDGKTGKQLFTVRPFENAFTGGVFVAAGDLDGDGVPELVVTPDEGGGPVVVVYDARGEQIVRFFGIDDPKFRGGARVSVGDVNGDGFADLIVAAGFGGGPRIAVFDGSTVQSGQPTRLLADFFAFETGLRNGVYIAAGDVNGDGKADLIFGGGPGGGPRVRIADTSQLLQAGSFLTLDDVPNAQLANFFSGSVDSRGGARVAAEDIDGDRRADLVVGDGAKAGSKVTRYAGKDIPIDGLPPVFDEIDSFNGFAGGVFVG